MNYIIQIVDITKKDIEDQIRSLYKAAFGMKELPPEGHFFKNTNTNASNTSFFLAAIEDGVIIGCNGFIAVDFYINNKIYTCYQSCHTATHPQHQGKKVFANLINYAKEYLKSNGAGFIFGVPNDNSHPIFVKKLGFSEIPQLVLRIPNIPLLRNLWFNSKEVSRVTELMSQSLFVREDQVLAWKKQEQREPVEVVEVGESFAWGKLNKVRKFGITFNSFFIGGIYLKSPGDYEKLIRKIFSDYRISYVQIVTCESSSYNLLLKKWKKANMNGFIFFDLNIGAVRHINITSGILDVY